MTVADASKKISELITKGYGDLPLIGCASENLGEVNEFQVGIYEKENADFYESSNPNAIFVNVPAYWE